MKPAQMQHNNVGSNNTWAGVSKDNIRCPCTWFVLHPRDVLLSTIYAYITAVQKELERQGIPAEMQSANEMRW